MATENPRVWFKSISLGNVRSFGTQQTINFTEDGTDNGKVAQWNIILGDNGTGKTTVLKSLCLLTEANQITLSHYERNLMWIANFKFIISKENQQQKAFFGLYNDPHRDGPRLSLKKLYSEDNIEPPFICAYGAVRRVGNSAITVEKVNTIQNLFDESAALTNAEELLVQADYLDLKEKEADNHQKNNYNRIKQILLNLLKDQISDIQIKAGVINRFNPPQVFFKTPYGEVRLHELSLGYKTLIAWMVDFTKGLLDRYPDSENPLAEPAVCLVDEIDLHLHPKFQRTIIQFLTDTFPNTQFIVTAHSPLIVQSAEDANIILLKREGNETVVADGIDVHSWRIDQILSSDLFGGIGGRAPQIEEKMARRRALIRKDDRTPEEVQELDTLEKELNELPVMETREALKAIDIISKAVIAEG